MKEIIVSKHASLNMLNRGANDEEVKSCIQSNKWELAKGTKFKTRRTFSFDAISPVNGKHYVLKTVEAIFVDEPNAITVVTVKVYYHNE